MLFLIDVGRSSNGRNFVVEKTVHRIKVLRSPEA